MPRQDVFHGAGTNAPLHPHWQAMLHKPMARMPRKIQRYSVLFLLLLAVVWLVWRNHLGPRYARHRQEIREMDAVPEATYGSNSRPGFKDMIHIKTLDERHLPVGDKRLVVVGDVHGCVKELKELMKKINFNPHRDHLILTGDIVNKGPDSPGVVAFAQKIGASSVRGNHEDKLLLTIAEMDAHHVPLPGPYEDTESTSDFLDESSNAHRDQKRRKLAKQFSKKQIAWLKECPVILRVGNVVGIGEVAVVHAGLVPDIPLEKQDPFHVMNMRTIDLNTRTPSENREGTQWQKFWNYKQKKLPAHKRLTVIYGHDARRGKNINKYSKGLDSGCVRGGHLTALVIDSRGREKYVHVKCKGYVQ